MPGRPAGRGCLLSLFLPSLPFLLLALIAIGIVMDTVAATWRRCLEVCRVAVVVGSPGRQSSEEL